MANTGKTNRSTTTSNCSTTACATTRGTTTQALNYHQQHLEDLRQAAATDLRNFEARQQRARLATWRQKLLNSDASTYQWIKSTNTTRTRHLQLNNAPPYATTTTTVTTTTAEALTAIQHFWRRIWQRKRPTTSQATHAATEHLGQARPQPTWEPLAASALYKAAQAQKGKAQSTGNGWLAWERLVTHPTKSMA